MDDRISEGLRRSYRLVRKLGEGGMGVVYLAHQEALGRDVALKLLKDLAAEEVARFEREGKTLAALRHPAILAVYDAGVDGGTPYLACELADGESLRQALDRAPLPLGRAVGVVRDVADALAHAHEHHVVHRDVKPDNVFMLRDGSIKLGDFGLARTTGAGHTLTAAGTVMGTPAYIAPEQAEGSGPLPASDQYALGVMAFELACGSTPFTGASPMEVIAARLQRPAPKLGEVAPGVPAALAAAVDRMLAREPEKRFPSMRDVVATLDETAAGLGDAGARVPRTGGRVSGRARAVAGAMATGATVTRPASRVAVDTVASAVSAAPVSRAGPIAGVVAALALGAAALVGTRGRAVPAPSPVATPPPPSVAASAAPAPIPAWVQAPAARTPEAVESWLAGWDALTAYDARLDGGKSPNFTARELRQAAVALAGALRGAPIADAKRRQEAVSQLELANQIGRAHSVADLPDLTDLYPDDLRPGASIEGIMPLFVADHKVLTNGLMIEAVRQVDTRDVGEIALPANAPPAPSYVVSMAFDTIDDGVDACVFRVDIGAPDGRTWHLVPTTVKHPHGPQARSHTLPRSVLSGKLKVAVRYQKVRVTTQEVMKPMPLLGRHVKFAVWSRAK